jgi:hypothetical protein
MHLCIGGFSSLERLVELKIALIIKLLRAFYLHVMCEGFDLVKHLVANNFLFFTTSDKR